jgi:hypothetical protein
MVPAGHFAPALKCRKNSDEIDSPVKAVAVGVVRPADASAAQRLPMAALTLVAGTHARSSQWPSAAGT